MILLCEVECSDSVDIGLAFLSLSPDRARYLLDVQDIVGKTAKVIKDLWAFELVDYCYFLESENAFEETVDEKLDKVNQSWLMDLYNDQEDIELYPDDKILIEAAEECESHVFYCYTVIITEKDFIWTALAKYDSVPIKTVPIPRKILERIAEVI